MRRKPAQTRLRAYAPGDLAALYDICLATGNDGEDAGPLYRDPDLVGHVYAGPYAALEPESCFVIEDTRGVCGYLVGTTDSHAFAARCERDWYPALRRRYPPPDPDDESRDARMCRAIHLGYRPADDLRRYPAHLHVDLLPRARGKGLGSVLLLRFIEHAANAGATGVHLQTGITSHARRFYERHGFEVRSSDARAVTYVLPIDRT